MKSDLARRLSLDCPIIQAPMAGGPGTPELVAAVSNAGGLGSLAAGMLSPEAIMREAGRVRSLSRRSYNVNLFVVENPRIDQADLSRAQARLAPAFAELGITQEAPPVRFCEDLEAQLEAVISLAPAMASFTFGVLKREQVAALQKAGCLVMGTATHLAEARAWAEAGADVVCAQGWEAGGHRGTFLGDPGSSQVGLMALLPQLVNELDLPVVAAGGIMDGRGIAAAMLLGAEAAQLGTAFMCCPEAATHPEWQRRMSNAGDASTRVTRLFSGKPARGLVNRFMEELREEEAWVPEYPVQNALTMGLRKAAARVSNGDYLSLWAGQGVARVRRLPAAQLLKTLTAEMADAFKPRADQGA